MIDAIIFTKPNFAYQKLLKPRYGRGIGGPFDWSCSHVYNDSIVLCYWVVCDRMCPCISSQFPTATRRPPSWGAGTCRARRWCSTTWPRP